MSSRDTVTTMAGEAAATRETQIYIGTSGWSYDHWQGILYPRPTPTGKRLAFYLGRGYNTVEVNNTFYRWPKPAVFAAWRSATPPGFRLTIKASRGLTQFKKLNEPEAWIARMAEGLDELADGDNRDNNRLGVVLAQLPPHFPIDLGRLAYFLRQVPARFPVAMEFRHPSWHENPETFALLEEHGAAYCVMSGANLPCVLRATARFVYVRLHGPDPTYLYGGSYSDDDLRWWADRIGEWRAQGRSVWAYFNNDGDGNAVRNADTLRRFVE